MKPGIRRIAFVIAFLALVAGVSAGMVFAQTAPPAGPAHGRQTRQHAGMGPGQGGPFQHLNLTDDQKTKIQALVQQQRQAHQTEARQLRDLQQQLKNAIFADSGPGDTGAIQQQITTLQAQLEADRVNLQKQIAAVLTPDQRKQVRDLPGPFMGGGMGRGMGMRQHAPGF